MSMADFPALTTVFTAPAACSSHWTWTSSDDATTTIWQDFPAGGSAPEISSCYPSPSGTWADSGNVGTYSPGICPSGHTTAGVWWDATTTTAVCCSSGYTYTGEDVGCTRTFSDLTSTITVEISTGGSTSTYMSEITIASGEAVQWAVAVMYQSQDLTLFPSDSQPTLFNAAAATVATSSQASPAGAVDGTITSTSGSDPTSTPTDHSSSSPSSGTIAAIAISVVLGLFLLIGLAFFLVFRRRLQRARSETPLPDLNTGEYPIGPPTTQPFWRRSRSRYEMSADQIPRAELDASSPPGTTTGFIAEKNTGSPPVRATPRFEEVSPSSAADDETLEELEKEELMIKERKARLLARRSRNE